MPTFADFVEALADGVTAQQTDLVPVVRDGVALRVPASQFAEAAAAVAAHVAAADPHVQYQKESEKGSAGGYASLDGGGTIPDAQIPDTIARDTEINSAISTHEAAANPHPGYLTPSELPFINVVDQGIPANGSDIVVAVNALIAATPAAGAVIVFPPGLYGTSLPIEIRKDNIHIRAHGATFRPTAGWAASGEVGGGGGGSQISGVFSFVSANYCSIEGAYIDSRTNSASANGIAFLPEGAGGSGTPCTYCRAEKCRVENKIGSNYHIWTVRGKHIRILNNDVDGGMTSYTASTTQEGIEAMGGEDVLFQGNRIKNVGGAGINIGVAALAEGAGHLSNLQVLDNEIEGCKRGIMSQPFYDATNGDQYFRDILIARNQILGCWTTGIFNLINTASVTVDGYVVIDNTIRGPASGGQAASTAIFWDNQVASVSTVNLRNISWAGNKAIDIPTTDVTAPFHIKYCADFDFRNNKLSQTLASLSGTCQGLLVVGCTNFQLNDNVINGARDAGMNIWTSTFFDACRNTVLNFNKRGAGVAGIVIQTGCADFTLCDNKLDSSTASSLWINTAAAGLDRFLLRGNRYLNISANIGTGAMYYLNEDKNWVANTAVARKAVRKPVASGSLPRLLAECIVAGTTHSTTEPVWPNAEGAIIVDNGVTWVMRSIM